MPPPRWQLHLHQQRSQKTLLTLLAQPTLLALLALPALLALLALPALLVQLVPVQRGWLRRALPPAPRLAQGWRPALQQPKPPAQGKPWGAGRSQLQALAPPQKRQG